MFGIFKKKKESTNPALCIATEMSIYSNRLVNTIDEFLTLHPKYLNNRNNIIDELQWIVATGGLIAIMLRSDFKTSRASYEDLIELYRTSKPIKNSLSMISEEFLKRLASRFDSYLFRFNRGLSLRDSSEKSYNESLFDVANESMRYFLGESRRSEVDIDNILSLQRRTLSSDEMEIFVKDILNDSVKLFFKKFEKFEFV
jgi:hypothetical protein